MLVYRAESIEDKFLGAYGIDLPNGSSLASTITSGTNHPIPSEDPLMADRYNNTPNIRAYYYGCSSLQQLHEWFDCHDYYCDADQVALITVYEVPDEFVIVGSQQVAFLLEKAVTQKHIAFTESLEMV